MANGIFITGTDTSVGKTVAAAVIARLVSRTGARVGIMKPVTSGCIEREGKLVSEDAELLAWGAGIPTVTPDMTPYLLKEPLAPSEAASREGVRIHLSLIRDTYLRLEKEYDFMIVEGAGGLMVPLAGGMLVADLISTMNLPALVVTRPNLGTINHTLLTTFAARQMGIKVAGIIINRYPAEPGEAESYAPHLLGSLAGAPILGIFPGIEESDPKILVDRVADAASGHLLHPFLLKELGIG